MALKSSIEFKGTKDGLIIHLNEVSDFEYVREQLIKKLEMARNFFAGAKVAAIEGRSLTENEEKEIIDIINNRFGMVMVEKNNNSIEKEDIFKGLDEGHTKFLRWTLRSGSKIEFKGNVVVMGDVNPGAEIIAHGNIVVMGALRGVAHAGANGNTKAFVAAIKLQPTKLRIANYIARAPDRNYYKPEYPEIAFINEDMIIIEPYLTKNR
jgi:septum site-determining protein MinC